MKQTWIIAGVSALAFSATALLAASTAEARGQDRKAPGFEELDIDGDGLLTEKEMLARRAAQFAETDTDGDGLLSAEEMVEKARQAFAERIQPGVARRIARQDENGDGMISPEEMGPPEGRGARMFSRLDENGDGGISEEEFETARQWRRGFRAGRRHGRGIGTE